MSEDLGILILDFDFAGEEGMHMAVEESSKKRHRIFMNQK